MNEIWEQHTERNSSCDHCDKRNVTVTVYTHPDDVVSLCKSCDDK